MRTIVTTIRQQYLGAFALVILLGGVAAAATGGNLKLGASNTADKRTVLQNTGTGPALQLTSKAGQPPLSVGNTVQVPKLNASLLGGKAASAFAVASSVYTKAQSDANYAAAGSSYTKAQSDSKYATTGSSYTKAQSDTKYAAAGTSYTKAEGDDRYGRILTVLDWSGNSQPDGAEAQVLSQAVSIPGPGIVKVMLEADAASISGATPIFTAKINGTGGNGGTVFAENGYGVAGAGNVTVTVHVFDVGGDSEVGGNGKLVVVYFPF